MSEHYYSRTQKVESDPKFWDFTLKNNQFRFKTDNGVFSKREVDFGSRLLIESFEMPNTEGLYPRCRLWLWSNRSIYCEKLS